MSALAVGFFDGVHLGHQAILKGADAALTFRNHPLAVLAPDQAPRLIMTLEERVAAIKACGVKDVTVLDFTRELAALPPGEFANSFLRRSGDRTTLAPLLRKAAVGGLIRPVLRCGANWRFGAGGTGDAAFLRSCGMDVEVLPYAEYKGEPISSSRIRRCLENGAVEDANAMMGRWYAVRGTRIEGKGLGRELGYPTVNVEVLRHGLDGFDECSRILLRHGVYEVEVDGLRGIANYGLAPTMGDKAWDRPILEIHFLGDPSELLNSPDACPEIGVSFLRFVRPEKTFDSIDDLKRQIAADCATIRT